MATPTHDLDGTLILEATMPIVTQVTEDHARVTGKAFRDATRVQESLTAGIERKALRWIGMRLPAWVQSDQLTLLGFLAMFLAGASYAFTHWDRNGLLFATICIVLNWFGDSLDGTIARMRNRQRPRYGFSAPRS